MVYGKCQGQIRHGGIRILGRRISKAIVQSCDSEVGVVIEIPICCTYHSHEVFAKESCIQAAEPVQKKDVYFRKKNSDLSSVIPDLELYH